MRLQGGAASVSKPLVEIGGRPIVWHVMKWYRQFGCREFVLCLGYLGGTIKEHFIQYEPWRHDNVTVQVDAGGTRVEALAPADDWNLSLVDTGEETPTGGRLLRARDWIDDDLFLVNYSDGLSDLDLNALVEFHRGHGKIATLTAVRPRSQFGVIELQADRVLTFHEKPRTEDWINGGFFVFSRRIFDFLEPTANLEADTLPRLAAAGELMAFQHSGRWECMDTYKDTAHLHQLWQSGEAFWKVW